MNYLLLLLVALLPLAQRAQGDELHIMSLRDFDLDYSSIRNHRDSYLQYDDCYKDTGNECFRYGIATDFTIDLVGQGNYGLYWGNRVHSAATNAQMREIGWMYELGLQLGPDVQIYADHHSRHVLDADRPERFPLDNFYGIRVTFYRRDKDTK